jgi:DNA-directed RNA polymerase specialized sigma24 family protein
MDDSAEHTESSIFQRTRPSELKRAGGGDTEALGRLIAQYHVPLNIFLTLAFPTLKPYAEEILQDFAQDRILREGWLARVDLNRGRFRDFLKTSLRNYVLNWLRKRRQQEDRLWPLEDLELPEQQASTADAFDLEWMRTILAETLRRMEEECRLPGHHQPRRGQTWEIFKLRLIEPALQDTKPPSYGELVKRFDLKSPTEGTNMLLDAKRRFERHLFKVVAEYETTDDLARATEILDLKQALSRLSGRR